MSYCVFLRDGFPPPELKYLVDMMWFFWIYFLTFWLHKLLMIHMMWVGRQYCSATIGKSLWNKTGIVGLLWRTESRNTDFGGSLRALTQLVAASLYDCYISPMHCMWPLALANTLFLAVMWSSFVSKQLPAQSFGGNEQGQLLWSLDGVGGWRDGWMDVCCGSGSTCFRNDYVRDCF